MANSTSENTQKKAARIELEDMGFLEGKMGKLKINHGDNLSSMSSRYTQRLLKIYNDCCMEDEGGAVFVVKHGDL